MTDAASGHAIAEDGTEPNIVREVVGVFDTVTHLEQAVEQLGIAGIDRSAISVLGTKKSPPHQPGAGEAQAMPRSIVDISDDPSTPTTAFTSDISWSEARGVSTAVPLMIGGFGAAWVVGAAGGALLLAIGATVVSGAVGAGLGALLYHAVTRHHAEAIRDQVERGGLILWVRVFDKPTEDRVLAVLRECGAAFVHTHMIDRPWGAANSPLYGVQLDPFLENDESPDPA
jgi:hypothetical protein